MPRSGSITHANPVGLRPAKTARVSFADLFFRLGKTKESGRREFGDVSDPTDRISQIGRRYWSSNQRDLRYSSLCSCGLSSQTARSLGWRRSANEPGWLLTFFSFPAPAFCFSCAQSPPAHDGKVVRLDGAQGGVWRCMRRCCVSQT